MKKIEIIISSVLILLIFSIASFSQDKFLPWNADVMVADENIELKNQDTDKIINIFNGLQAGSYFLILGFQKFISPQDGPNCRFIPTCSLYGKIAVLRYGALLGAFLAGDRIIRCNPFNAPGEDPVPDSIF